MAKKVVIFSTIRWDIRGPKLVHSINIINQGSSRIIFSPKETLKIYDKLCKAYHKKSDEEARSCQEV